MPGGGGHRTGRIGSSGRPNPNRSLWGGRQKQTHSPARGGKAKERRREGRKPDSLRQKKKWEPYKVEGDEKPNRTEEPPGRRSANPQGNKKRGGRHPEQKKRKKETLSLSVFWWKKKRESATKKGVAKKGVDNSDKRCPARVTGGVQKLIGGKGGQRNKDQRFEKLGRVGEKSYISQKRGGGDPKVVFYRY